MFTILCIFLCTLIYSVFRYVATVTIFMGNCYNGFFIFISLLHYLAEIPVLVKLFIKTKIFLYLHFFCSPIRVPSFHSGNWNAGLSQKTRYGGESLIDIMNTVRDCHCSKRCIVILNMKTLLWPRISRRSYANIRRWRESVAKQLRFTSLVC